MKITKFVHSCLLVEMPAPVNRTALFDPGNMSVAALSVDSLEFLDDIFITHGHPDHMDAGLIKKLVAKFPDVRITAPPDAVEQLKAEGILASTEVPEGVNLFEAPHEKTYPMFPPPDEYGYHYLDKLSHPGDSHSFGETKAILALPVTAPWGATVTAVNLALGLKPRYIVPIHDWHYRDEARESTYDRLEQIFGAEGITFSKMETGKPVVFDV
jgi:L-ascorbate metabolism protein UlaG (beta-lactamase superfamily)